MGARHCQVEVLTGRGHPGQGTGWGPRCALSPRLCAGRTHRRLPGVALGHICSWHPNGDKLGSFLAHG